HNGDRRNREQSNLVRLIRLTDEDEFFTKLLQNIYLAVFTGKIDNIERPLRYNILPRAIEKFEPAFATDVLLAERDGFVLHYMECFEAWKEEIAADDEEVVGIRLSNNDLNEVSNVLSYGKDKTVQFFISAIVNQAAKEGKVDMAKLLADLRNGA